MTTQRIQVFHSSDMYEVTLRDTTILHIIRVLGDTQLERQFLFNDLPLAVKRKIVTAILHAQTQHP